MAYSLVSGDRIVDSDKVSWLSALSGTPAGNNTLPIHRWFRFPAGFSAKFIDEMFNRLVEESNGLPIIDPFTGTATTLICGQARGLKCIGIEAHPLLFRIGRAKINWDIDADKLESATEHFLSKIQVNEVQSNGVEIYPPLVRKCFSVKVLNRITLALNVLRSMQTSVDDCIYEFLWLSILCILRQVSHAGTAPWQYILPNKEKGNHKDVIPAIKKQLNQMVQDLIYVQNHYGKPIQKSQLIQGDARNLELISASSIGFGICSPPYLNNFDYSDATRLEMFTLGYAHSWGDITREIRTKLITSATTQVKRSNFDPDAILQSIELKIRTRVLQGVTTLSRIRKERGGKKNYDVMVAQYFADMMKVICELSRVLTHRSLFIMIVGDSAPYGVYIPTDEILANLALTAGFSQYQIVKLRDRNTRWSNRKHTVPLRESAIFLRR